MTTPTAASQRDLLELLSELVCPEELGARLRLLATEISGELGALAPLVERATELLKEDDQRYRAIDARLEEMVDEDQRNALRDVMTSLSPTHVLLGSLFELIKLGERTERAMDAGLAMSEIGGAQ